VERLILQRLANQRLLRSEFRDAAAAVAWLGAVQAQNLAEAKWSLGQRTTGCTDADIERAFNDGAILRTHVLRSTWHFVTPADIGWMLTITAPRVQQASAYVYRQFELDPETRSRARRVIARALEDGGPLTRAELGLALRRGGIIATGVRLGLMTIDLEVSQVMCSGPMRGRQITYARWDARVPPTRGVTIEDALAALTRRYFTSHGPATVKDFTWWSGLTVRDVKLGIELVGKAIERSQVGGTDYWSMPSVQPARPRAAVVHLLPTYDEYLIGYKDREVIGSSRLTMSSQFTNHLVIDGVVAGVWKGIAGKNGLAIDTQLRRRLTAAERSALDRAAARYRAFLRG
jgi:winged helix DNA-binding protein